MPVPLTITQDIAAKTLTWESRPSEILCQVAQVYTVTYGVRLVRVDGGEENGEILNWYTPQNTEKTFDVSLSQIISGCNTVTGPTLWPFEASGYGAVDFNVDILRTVFFDTAANNFDKHPMFTKIKANRNEGCWTTNGWYFADENENYEILANICGSYFFQNCVLSSEYSSVIGEEVIGATITWTENV